MNRIENIKQEFLKPVPILYTYKGHIEQSLVSKDFNKAVDIVLTENINEVKQLTFNIPLSEERKLDHNSLEKLVYFNGIYFIIKEINEDSDNKTIKVSAEEICTALKTVYCENVTRIGATPRSIFDAIISATKFTNLGYIWLGTDVSDGVYRHVVTESETSCYENLIALAKIFDGHIEFSYDESGQGYVYLRTKPIETGKFIKKDIEMKSLNITASSKDLFTKYFPTGKTDDYSITLDVQSVNNGESIMKDYSYYQNLGIPDEIIINDPLYNSLRTFNDDSYIDATDLLNVSKQELKKCSQPIFEAEVGMSDFSVFEDSPIEAPKIGMILHCVDKSIDFIFDCTIVGIERPYSNPADVKIQISNVIKYDTNQQNISHTIDTVNKVTSNDPRDTDGNIIGTGETYIKMESVKDGDHVNQIIRNEQVRSLITQTASEISLRVDAVNQSYAELKVESDKITSHVEDIADTSQRTYSEIQQTATKIRAVVVQGDEGGSWELSKDAFQVAFLKSSADITTIDEFGITASNVDGSRTRMGSKGLEHIDGTISKPYHYLSYTHVYNGLRGNGKSYREYNYPLPSLFSNIDNPDANIAISASIAKVYDSNDGSECLQYWSGAYAEIIDGQIQLRVMSTFRDYTYASGDTGHWVDEFSEPREGYIDVSITIIA